eukprot:599321-Pyramimonas_sp.AAC.1
MARLHERIRAKEAARNTISRTRTPCWATAASWRAWRALERKSWVLLVGHPRLNRRYRGLASPGYVASFCC